MALGIRFGNPSESIWEGWRMDAEIFDDRAHAPTVFGVDVLLGSVASHSKLERGLRLLHNKKGGFDGDYRGRWIKDSIKGSVQ